MYFPKQSSQSNETQKQKEVYLVAVRAETNTQGVLKLVIEEYQPQEPSNHIIELPLGKNLMDKISKTKAYYSLIRYHSSYSISEILQAE